MRSHHELWIWGALLLPEAAQLSRDDPSQPCPEVAPCYTSPVDPSLQIQQPHTRRHWWDWPLQELALALCFTAWFWSLLGQLQEVPSWDFYTSTCWITTWKSPIIVKGKQLGGNASAPVWIPVGSRMGIARKTHDQGRTPLLGPYKQRPAPGVQRTTHVRVPTTTISPRVAPNESAEQPPCGYWDKQMIASLPQTSQPHVFSSAKLGALSFLRTAPLCHTTATAPAEMGPHHGAGDRQEKLYKCLARTNIFSFFFFSKFPRQMQQEGEKRGFAEPENKGEQRCFGLFSTGYSCG